MKLLVVGLVFFALVFLFDRVMVALERRGLVYWREDRGSALGAAMGGVQEIWEPASKHVHDVQRWEADRREDEDAGAPPEIALREGRAYVYRPEG
jgi:hypothetical protein